MAYVIYGKHPGFGDFVAHGLPVDASRRLEKWVGRVLPDLRTGLGEAWASVWDSAPVLRFWCGGDVLGVPFYGLWAPSRDAVGRRYPLILGLSGGAAPPPVQKGHEAARYAQLEAQLGRVARAEVGQGGVQALIDLLDPMPEDDEALDQMPASGMLWAQRADGDLDRLMQDAAAPDAAHAQCGRSHWWCDAVRGRAAAWLAVTGLPQADALHWLMVDAQQEVPSAQEDDNAPGGREL
ncbi:type VI secretion system-associated protein TagF [Tateyamaria sp. ANG-S1]|uniref:type VI secretion system-associated protein TagF n=1 Tax=Tateyamaria sp. ANG-S1 TaxID=1577905 RepID=UPI000689CC3E|nr:type VI secretion system-associated protein TagF [Tateyamaria sp. ANG-S1]